MTANSIGTVGGYEIFSLNKNTITIQKPSSGGGTSSKSQAAAAAAVAAAQHHHHQATTAANLSNFLNVRFEISQNAQQQPDTKTTTSSKSSKYRKSIKISSVSCRPLSALDTGDMNVPDIQLKAYEFTEKCLSFRLASIDLNSDPQQQRRNFHVKLINLYEKFLCALVNFTQQPSGQPSFKLFRIKHEETSSTTTTTTTSTGATTPTTQLTPPQSSATLASTSHSTSSLSSMSTSSSLAQLPAEMKSVEATAPAATVVAATPPALFSGNCLAATSSSRLNLTEFILTSIPSASLISHVTTIMPISVSTLEDDNDLKYIAILSETGVISIIDPNRCCKLIDFPSPDDETDRFVHMIYCYGIDKICALTNAGKIYLISTRVFPLVNQAVLDEISGAICLNDPNKKLLVDANIDSNVRVKKNYYNL